MKVQERNEENKEKKQKKRKKKDKDSHVLKRIYKLREIIQKEFPSTI
jgi:hypothetical protein